MKVQFLLNKFIFDLNYLNIYIFLLNFIANINFLKTNGEIQYNFYCFFFSIFFKKQVYFLTELS